MEEQDLRFELFMKSAVFLFLDLTHFDLISGAAAKTRRQKIALATDEVFEGRIVLPLQGNWVLRVEWCVVMALGFQPTTQPTIPVSLCDLRCVWQSPRACKTSASTVHHQTRRGCVPLFSSLADLTFFWCHFWGHFDCRIRAERGLTGLQENLVFD